MILIKINSFLTTHTYLMLFCNPFYSCDIEAKYCSFPLQGRMSTSTPLSADMVTTLVATITGMWLAFNRIIVDNSGFPRVRFNVTFNIQCCGLRKIKKRQRNGLGESTQSGTNGKMYCTGQNNSISWHSEVTRLSTIRYCWIFIRDQLD